MATKSLILNVNSQPGSAPESDWVFRQAFAAARVGYSDTAWEMLPSHERTAAIYREMRRLDWQAVARTLQGPAAHGTWALAMAPGSDDP